MEIDNEHKEKIDEILSEYKKDSVSFYRLSDCAYVSDANILVVGTTGSGKTRNVIVPNVENSSESLIIVDIKGDLIKKYSGILNKKGYAVRCVDFTNSYTLDESNEDILENTDFLKFPKVKSVLFLKLSATNLDDKVLNKLNSFLSFALKNLVKILETDVINDNMSVNPYPIRFIFDDFDLSIRFPEFYVAVNTLKKFNIFFTIAVQSVDGIINVYPDFYKTILGSFQVVCYTGGNGQSTLEYISNISEYSLQDVLNLKTDSILIKIKGKEPIIDKKIS